jgi:hypothetical protein
MLTADRQSERGGTIACTRVLQVTRLRLRIAR